MRVYIHFIPHCQGIVKCFLHFSENNWRELGEIAEVLQTLITATLCFFLPFFYMGFYGTLWYSTGHSFRSMVFIALVALRPK